MILPVIGAVRCFTWNIVPSPSAYRKEREMSAETVTDVREVRPVGWTGPTGARVVAHVRVWSPLDNHTPARSDATCTLEQYEWPDGEIQYSIPGGLDVFPHAVRALWLLDDGENVTVLYTAGWHERQRYLTLHPFPAGLVGGFGPRKMYHLTIQKES